MLEQSFIEGDETKIEGKGSAADLIMIKRLDAILERKLEMTDTDRRFYAYSLRMMERFRAMGFADDYIPKSNPSLWNNLHTATLEDFKLSDDESLRYTDEAIDAAKKQEVEAFECVSGSKSSIAKLEQAVRQENLRDLLSVLAIGLAFPSIDTLFGRYRFEVIARGELWRAHEELFHEGVLAEGNAAVAIPGPNWRIPEFMIDKRYKE
jgi:hypothetical protein